MQGRVDKTDKHREWEAIEQRIRDYFIRLCEKDPCKIKVIERPPGFECHLLQMIDEHYNTSSNVRSSLALNSEGSREVYIKCLTGWRNYPVIRLNFASINGVTCDEIDDTFLKLLASQTRKFSKILNEYIAHPDRLDDMKIYIDVIRGRPINDAVHPLEWLIEVIHRATEKKVVVLIDSFDKPACGASLLEKQKVESWMSKISGIIQDTNPAIHFAMLSCSIPIATPANAGHRSALHGKYTHSMLLTDDELRSVLTDANDNKIRKIKEHLGGYYNGTSADKIAYGFLANIKKVKNTQAAFDNMAVYESLIEFCMRRLKHNEEWAILSALSSLLDGNCYLLGKSELNVDFTFYKNEYTTSDIMLILHKIGLLTLKNVNEQTDSVELVIPNVKATECIKANMNRWLKVFTAQNDLLLRV